ncbi:phospholipase D family protein [Bacillus sp. JJ634]
MFRPDKDRLDYGTLMAPPEGYQLSRAIGTTYSLELEALLGIPVALSFAQSVEVSQKRDRIYLIEALRRSTEHIKVYCQKGKIHVPKAQYPLYALLENMITQVNINPYSFHPKLWILRYVHQVNPKDIKYRLLVLSRNITFDRSWDVSMCVDGTVGTRKIRSNQPLVDFVTYLTQQADFEGSQEFIKELYKVQFDIKGDRKSIFQSIGFCPIGIPNSAYEQDLLHTDYDNLLIISPFLTDQTVKNLNNRNKGETNTYLFSRQEELLKLKPKTLEGIEAYHLKELVVEGEKLIDSEDANHKEQDIHAKVYIGEHDQQTDVYLGSANCSYNAFHGNVEFLVKLSADTKYLKVSDVLRDLLPEDEKKQYFEQFIPSANQDQEVDETKQAKKMLEQKIRELCKLSIHGNVIENGEHYNLIVESEEIVMLEDMSITVYPLTTSGLKREFKPYLSFEKLTEQEITRFFVFDCRYMEEQEKILLKINVSNIPESREKNILKAIISNKQAFLAYMNFLLGDGSVMDFLEAQLDPKENDQSVSLNRNPVIKKDMFEKMLKAAANEPFKLKTIGDVMEFFSDEEEIVPKDFKSLYKEFSKFAR